MIPKKIHYCWFGGNPLPKLAEKCIKSWKKFCPDYEIIRWDESNFDIATCPLYVRQAYEAKKWAFVTDYIRLKVVYDNGGIYLDTDVEIINNIDFLLSNKAYFGFEADKYVNTGIGFGAEKGVDILKRIMDDYENIPFILPDGNMDMTPCPIRNTKPFIELGLIQNGETQTIDNCLVLATHILCPVSYYDQKEDFRDDTVSIHHFSSSWETKAKQKERKKRISKANRKEKIDSLKHIPNRMLKKLFGEKRYEKIKNRIKGK